MPIIKTRTGINNPSLIYGLIIPLIVNCTACRNQGSNAKKELVSSVSAGLERESMAYDGYPPAGTMMVLPKSPVQGQPFRILAVGGKSIREGKVIVDGPSGTLKSLKSKAGDELPYWRIDDFAPVSSGKYEAKLLEGQKVASQLEFVISQAEPDHSAGVMWKTVRGWDNGMEAVYSAWINALFQGCAEDVSWKALHEVTRNPDRNFLYNYLAMGEDDPAGKDKVIMQPDCADNPFLLRAYFSWKLGLPFGYHLCDRGYIGRNPKAGQWITNESAGLKINSVSAFNAFLRKVMDGVQSGTARTALDDENSDYYPVPLERTALRPGTVFADPYGHTLILVRWVPQTREHSGLLLSVDAQPDGTIGIKRFWKGNFLFNTSEVVGEPGFKAFRPITEQNGVPVLMRNKSLTQADGFIPFSLQQRKLKSDIFYHTMERLINPKPLDPETALLDLIEALHQQLMVRVTSVANGEAYLESHPGTVIPMPSNANGIFLAGGQWEDFSTPNRDLRLLIAIDAVLDFPDLIVRSPEDFDISGLSSPEQVKKKLQSILDQKVSELSVSYTRTNGSLQKLTLGEILKRRDAFEMAYNPNDGIEIRWGAPENSEERSSCHRHASSRQVETMNRVRVWFHKRLHPPT